MAEENLGAGQYLDQNFDFDIDTTGDIRAASGLNELEKDLSVQMAFTLSEFLGEPPTNETEAEVKRTVYRVAIADVRVSSVDQENIVVEWSRRLRELQIEVSVTTVTDDEYDMVFNV